MSNQFFFKAALVLLVSLLGTSAFAEESLWRDVDPDQIASRGQRWVVPQQARTVELDIAALRTLLQRAPMEGQLPTRASTSILSLPMPDGQFARFALVESPVMEAGLALKFPQIRTFAGQGLDDPGATLRLDVTHRGFHAQVLSAGGEIYIDPYQFHDEFHYVVYSRRGFGDSGKQYQCGTHETDPQHPAALPELAGVGVPNNPAGTSLRTYRVAIAATSSYTNAFGGTVADGIAGLTTLVNRLTGIYEREFALRLVLVANNDLIVYTNANVGPIGTSPTGPNPVIQTTIDNAIGFANYDLGHAVGGSGGGGAITPLGNVCGTSKARGFTSLNPPRGDIFDVDFVAHELGHQLGGSHTWNGCGGGGQWTATSAMEPGSGSTIMAYAGICPDNLLPNSDAYFHARSFTQIWQILNNGGSGNGNTVCGTTAPTGNDPPDLTAPANMTIPERTPFQLSAVATDPNAGDVVTYNWEQVDTGAQGSPSSTGDNGTAPLFRSFPASTSPTRIFPSLRYILDNANQPPATISLPPASGSFLPAEILPNPATGTRVMNFRVTARDNRAGGGGLRHSANVQVTAVADVGPFLVDNVSGTQTGGGTLAVAWSVANTDQAPISTSQVNILISLDGGYTFETLLAGTANDGAQTVTLPNVDSSRARIKVEAANGTGITAGNTYFDISDSNFQISAGGTPVSVNVSTAPADLIATQQGSPAPAARNIATIAGGVAPFTVAADTYPPNPELTILNLQVSGTTVSATAAASCQIAAPNPPSFRTYPAVLRVVDSGGSQASAVFPINVSNNSIPTLGTYATRSVAAGASTTASPSAAPADANNNQTSVVVSPTTLPGGGTVSVAPNGDVSIATTAGTTLGEYPITVSVNDSCGARTSKSFILRVLSPNPLLTIGTTTVTSGNGFLEPRECNTLDVAIGNSGGNPATIVSAVLSSTTPGVSVAQANSTYPDIPTDASQINDIDYEVSTAAGIACGSSVAFTHTVTYSGAAPTVLNFNLPIGGPPATNYGFASESGTTAPTGSALVAGSQSNNAIVPVTLPAGFAFQVYGTAVTQLRADTNGVLVFNAGTATSTSFNGTLPSAAYSAPALFALWDDLDTSTTVATGGGIYTQASGTTPNRTFDIEWRAVRFVSGAATPVAPTMVFTVRLHETSNRIEVFYTTVTGNGGGASGSSATVGIQAAGSGTTLTTFSNNTSALSAGQKLTVTRAPGVCSVGPNVCGELPEAIFENGFE
jgi:hypothetical protein